ncbi:hypothetical protein HPB52_024002 [Rhipicephalus sanguineus]|uniref:Cytochrome P450 n=1 Tax=Rhipicephalus sanguineus TaxID=34632 RepID=A0A9D4YR27_RHISA|nr:hypothetical protein HPB52_024002 [Rhipicephalus sanguineus]
MWAEVLFSFLLVVFSASLSWFLRRKRKLGHFRRHGIPGPEPDFFWGNYLQLKEDRIETARLTISKRRRLQALQSAVPRQRHSHPMTLCRDHHSGLRDVAVPPTVTKISGDSDKVGRDVWCSWPRYYVVVLMFPVFGAQVMERWIAEYGKVFGYYSGEMPFIVVSDPDMIKQCLVKEFPTFHDRAPFVLSVEPFTSCMLQLTGTHYFTSCRAKPD